MQKYMVCGSTRKITRAPDTVSEVFDSIAAWKPKGRGKDAINLIATDSLAALSTELELGPKGDKMGMKRAKEFSQGFRKLARIIANENYLMACSNQVREGDYGEVTPGGQAIPFYSSLRIRINQTKIIEKEVTLDNKVKVKKAKGIISSCYIKKSTVDDPYRTCDIHIIFNYGIDDVRANLQYIKDMTDETMYVTPDKRRYQGIDQAIAHIEEKELELTLRQHVIKIWNEIESKFKIDRKVKQR